MFLRAFARVHDVIPAARAVILGDGPQRSALTAERDALGMVEVVTFAGFRPNPVDEMNAADVVALSSRWEGSPLAVAECLSIGTPLVATAVGGVVGQLTDGVEARVVAIGDDQAFATAITHLLTHPEQARQMGRAGRALGAERFDPDRSTRAVEAVYQAVRRR
jgi:glycosyltransferase involved in cell wall biosynthesis